MSVQNKEMGVQNLHCLRNAPARPSRFAAATGCGGAVQRAGRFSSQTSRDDGLPRDVLARVAVDDQLLDGRLVLRADGHEPVHDHIAHLAEIWGDMGRYGEI